MPIADTVKLGADVQIFHPELVNLYGCTVGDGTRIGSFVEIQKNATIGSRCKVSSHSFICEGVVIEDEVFVGHGVMFTNDRLPRADGVMDRSRTADPELGGPDHRARLDQDRAQRRFRRRRSLAAGAGNRSQAASALASAGANLII